MKSLTVSRIKIKPNQEMKLSLRQFCFKIFIVRHHSLQNSKQQDKNNSTLACWLSFLVDSWTVDSSNGCLWWIRCHIRIMLMAARLLKSALLYPCAEISRRRLLERFNPGDVSWIKPREVCTSEQKLEEVFTFRVAVYRPDDKTTKCFRQAETAGFGPWHRDIVVQRKLSNSCILL